MVNICSEKMSGVVASNADEKRRSNLKRAATEILEVKSSMEEKESDEGENDIKPKKARLNNGGGPQTPGDGNSTRSTPREGRVQEVHATFCRW